MHPLTPHSKPSLKENRVPGRLGDIGSHLWPRVISSMVTIYSLVSLPQQSLRGFKVGAFSLGDLGACIYVHSSKYFLLPLLALGQAI